MCLTKQVLPLPQSVSISSFHRLTLSESATIMVCKALCPLNHTNILLLFLILKNLIKVHFDLVAIAQALHF